MSVFVVRAFVRLREILATNKELADRLDELEQHLETHDGTIREIVKAMKELMIPARRRRSKIGFELPKAQIA